MPSAKQAAEAIGAYRAEKGKSRIRRYGTRKWEPATSGTKLYPGDEIDAAEGSGSISYAGGGEGKVRKGSFTRVARPLPRVEKKKGMKVESGVAHFGRK